ncbi:MAG: phosphatidylglycerol lysyltransferase domain-containing protein, partial [Muribaculaceae bacterium]|nr:phosphatidylglycerol lysyltransferase domain-containing protein [Muribaculaceae bacterium]
MNTHQLLLSPAASFATAHDITAELNASGIRRAVIRNLASKLEFKAIQHSDMQQIWHILRNAPGRTTDFSYAGLLMWVDFFHYEFAILNDTLFIKGLVEDDLDKPAFSLPIGTLPLETSVEILKEYCRQNDLTLEFSAVPEELTHELIDLGAKELAPLQDWSDYLYSAESLATLTGKK